jgi:hypothetical protein
MRVTCKLRVKGEVKVRGKGGRRPETGNLRPEGEGR